MRKSFTLFAFALCGFFCSSQPMFASSICAGVSTNLVSNCGFETGAFTGWTIGGNVLNPAGNYYGVDAFDANSGNFGAYVSQDFLDAGTTPVTLSETLTSTPGTVYNVVFWLEQDTAPTVGYTHLFNASWGGTTFLSVTPTVGLPGTVGAFTQYTFSETATGPSTTLKFTFENDDNYWSFDDVSVSVATPEPSTGLLGAIALALMLLVQGRRVAIQ